MEWSRVRRAEAVSVAHAVAPRAAASGPAHARLSVQSHPPGLGALLVAASRRWLPAAPLLAVTVLPSWTRRSATAIASTATLLLDRLPAGLLPGRAAHGCTASSVVAAQRAAALLDRAGDRGRQGAHHRLAPECGLRAAARRRIAWAGLRQ
jgi:hypothetical protein